MPSAARDDFATRLDFVDRIIEAHSLLPRRHHMALVNAGVVFLAAATEAFIEELYEEAAGLIFAGMTEKEFKALFKATSERFHTASVQNTEFLYFNLGMAWALNGLSWRSFSNATLRKVWTEFFETRNRVAHGAHVPVTVAKLHRWRNMLERFVPLFEQKVATHVETMSKRRPSW